MSRGNRTARGVMLDMAALATKHEMTRAGGNVPMNARGDRLNQDGTVRVKAEEIAVAHHNMQEAPANTPISDPKPIQAPIQEPEEFAEPEVPDLEEQFTQEPEAVSKITRTRDDGTKYVEIEYDDGSIETIELEE